jgi:hypothetical protein
MTEEAIDAVAVNTSKSPFTACQHHPNTEQNNNILAKF